MRALIVNANELIDFYLNKCFSVFLNSIYSSVYDEWREIDKENNKLQELINGIGNRLVKSISYSIEFVFNDTGKMALMDINYEDTIMTIMSNINKRKDIEKKQNSLINFFKQFYDSVSMTNREKNLYVFGNIVELLSKQIVENKEKFLVNGKIENKSLMPSDLPKFCRKMVECHLMTKKNAKTISDKIQEWNESKTELKELRDLTLVFEQEIISYFKKKGIIN